MKKLIVFFLGVSCLPGCQQNENVASVFTGNQSTYALQPASQYNISGTVTFKERKDGATTILISLKGITDNDQHPVHLHLGDITTNQASIAALLSPVAGSTGQSETIISEIYYPNEAKITYSDLTKLDACVNVHLASSGAEANVILAAGNIGSASAKVIPGGRIGVCKSTF